MHGWGVLVRHRNMSKRSRRWQIPVGVCNLGFDLATQRDLEFLGDNERVILGMPLDGRHTRTNDQDLPLVGQDSDSVNPVTRVLSKQRQYTILRFGEE